MRLLGIRARIIDGRAREDAESPARRAMDGLRRIVRALRSSTLSAEATHKLTAAQLFVLREIGRAPGLSLAQLGARTFTAQSSVSEVVSRLVQAGLVERRPSREDRRRIECWPTAHAQLLLQDAPDTIQERLLAGFHSLPDPQQAALAEALDAWIAAAGLSAVPSTMFFENHSADDAR